MPSEEAQVWSISSDDGQPLGWVKSHRQPVKLKTERAAITQWGSQVGAPKILTLLDESTLVLSHCQGQTSHTLSSSQATLLGETIATLHNIPYLDQDNLSLKEALNLREKNTLEQYPQVLSILKCRAYDELSMFQQMIDILKQEDESDKEYDFMTRVPCHRDLKIDHLLFESVTQHSSNKRGILNQKQVNSSFSKPVSSLNIIDWSQSRPDHWSSDWMHLLLDTQYRFESINTAWLSYWTKRLLIQNSKLTPREIQRYAQEILYGPFFKKRLCLHTLNTLTWGARHIGKSDQTVDIMLAIQVWERGLKELQQLKKFFLSE